MSDPQEPYANPPGWTDPYEDLTDLSGDDPLPQMEPPTTPPAQPPGSPLLTGLIIGLLLVALSVAVFQLLRPEDDGTAIEATTTTAPAGTTTTAPAGATTTAPAGGTTTTPPNIDPYPPVDPPIPVEKLKMKANGLRVNDNDIKDIVFGATADEAIGRLVASFGDPTQDTGWQVSTNQYGVCADDLERVVFFGPFAAIATKAGGQEIFNGFRNDLTFGDLTNPAANLETLSGLKIGDKVSTLKEIYGGEKVEFSTDPKLGDIYQVIGLSSGNLLLWGPVEGSSDDDRVIGIYASDVCGR
ncbi:MAG: hypothetical protein BMS9Abin20_1320 [Acidimicrobiia bacterium]|nr:MAG: hypothetical protein BMS9Abin20_1320 [Acidimicrobiia bacterium]